MEFQAPACLVLQLSSLQLCVSLFLPQESPHVTMGAAVQGAFTQQAVARGHPALPAQWPALTISLLCMTVLPPLSFSTVAPTIQEAPLPTVPKALGLWTAPRSTSFLMVVVSRYPGPWRSLTIDKGQQTNMSLAGKSQKAAHPLKSPK